MFKVTLRAQNLSVFVLIATFFLLYCAAPPMPVDPTEKAVQGLSYEVNPATYYTGEAIEQNAMSYDGDTPNTISISPALPESLVFDEQTGVISGTPREPLEASVFTVTASNQFGSDNVQLVVTVLQSKPRSLSYSEQSIQARVGVPIDTVYPAIEGGSVNQFSSSPSFPSGLTLDTSTGSISGTPTVASDSATYTVTASNASGSAEYDLSITINSNHSPAFARDTLYANVAVMDTLSITLAAGDADGDSVFFEKLGADTSGETDEDSVSISIMKSDTAVTIIAVFEAPRIKTFRLIAADRYQGYDTAFVRIMAYDSDSGGWITRSVDSTISEGSQIALDLLSQSTWNPDSVKFVLAPGVPQGDTIDTQNIYRYMPSYAESGNYAIKIIGETSGNSDTMMLNLAVMNSNRPPAWNSDTLNVSVAEGNTLSLSLPEKCNDPDGNADLSFGSVDPPNPTLGQLSDDGIFRYSADTSAGSFERLLEVSDGDMADTLVLIVTITDVNHSPEWDRDTIETTVAEGQTLSLTLGNFCTDPDGDHGLSFAKVDDETTPGEVVILQTTGAIYLFEPGHEDSGTHSVRIEVSDGFLSDTTVVLISVTNTNRPPQFSTGTPPASAVLLEGEKLELTLDATDPDGETIGNYHVIRTDLPRENSIDLNGETLAWQSAAGDSGTYLLIVGATDGIDTGSAEITVHFGDVNIHPSIRIDATVGSFQRMVSEGEMLRLSEGDSLHVLATVSDPNDSDIARINSWRSLPSQACGSLDETLAADSQSLVFTFVPNYDCIEADSLVFDSIMISASDDNPSPLQKKVVFSVLVRNTNREPQPADDVITVAEDSLVIFDAIENDSDPDGDALSLQSVAPAAHGDVSVTADGYVKYVPSPDYHGSDEVTYFVTDGENVVEGGVTVTVEPRNDPPQIIPIDDAAIKEGQSIALQLSGSDIDGGVVSFSCDPLPEGAGINGTSFEWTPGYSTCDSDSTFTLTFTAEDDSGATASSQMSLTVYDVKCTLSVSVKGGGSVSPGGPFIVEPHTEVSLTASPVSPAVFGIWTAITGSPVISAPASNQTTITLGETNAEIRATFVSDIVFWIDFESSDGNSWPDVSGNGLDLVDDNTAELKLVSGIGGGKALECTNTDYALRVNGSGGGMDFSSYTIEAWIYPHKVPADGANGWEHLIPIYHMAPSSSRGFQLSLLPDKKFYYWSNSSDWSGGWPTQPEVNNWYHLVVTYDETTGDIGYYVNGALELTTTVSDPMTIPTDRDISVGHVTGHDRFEGLLDDLRILSRSLTSDEIETRYNSLVTP